MQTHISHRPAPLRNTGSHQSPSSTRLLTIPTAFASQPTSRRPLLKLLGGGLMAGALSLQGRSVGAAASVPTTAESILEDPQFPAEFPFRADAFERYDEGSDSSFYASPRFVTHIDDAAIQALTDYYSEVFPPSGSKDKALLDICSSWISHYPKDYSAGKISGLGMNEEELARNPILTDFAVKDLNEDPVLPYPDSTFDVVTNAVSVDYLTKPMEVFKEMHRVLKPGGLAVMSFSNRCFPTKAVSIWTSTGDLDHVWIVGSYFHYAGGFDAPAAKEITKKGLLGQKGDPMYVVYARKQAI
ncbi:hypothetical protein Ndes2526A_g04808 [Nannochloris sp. 'desiccata']